MFNKFRKQNWIVISIVLALLLTSIALTINFALKISDNLKKTVIEDENRVLEIYSDYLKHYFNDINDDIYFLSNQERLKIYVNSNLKNIEYEADVKYLITEYLQHNKNYQKIAILDLNGQEKISLSDKENLELPDSALKKEIFNDNFLNSISSLSKNETFTQIINLKIKNTENSEYSLLPLLMIAAPLYNSDGDRTGIFLFEINLKKMGESLHENIIIQFDDKNVLTRNNAGVFKVEKYDYNFADSSGIFELSNSLEIHYHKIEYLPKKILTVGIIHSHFMLNNILKSLFISLYSIIFTLIVAFILYIFIIYKRFKNILDSNKAIISALAKLAEFRDEITGKHLEKTSQYAKILALELRKNKKFKKILTGEFIEDLSIAAQLHDIGKVGIKDSILLKNGPLTENEYDEMKKHVYIGEDIIEEIIKKTNIKFLFFSIGKNIIKYHHEKYDGSGYPFKIKCIEIPIEARIFALADAYDAIRSKRPYKEPFDHNVATERIKSDTAKHFDPDIVSAFLKCQDEFLRVSDS